MCLHLRLASLFFEHSPATIYIFSRTLCVGKYKSFEEEIAIYHDNFVPVLFVTLVINWQKYKKKLESRLTDALDLFALPALLG